MNKIEIMGKEYPLYIGLDFIRELDKKYKDTTIGGQYGFGINGVLISLAQYSAVGIVDFILAATSTLESPPTEKELEEQFSKWTADDVIEICENFMDALAESPMTKAQMAQMGVWMAAGINENL